MGGGGRWEEGEDEENRLMESRSTIESPGFLGAMAVGLGASSLAQRECCKLIIMEVQLVLDTDLVVDVHVKDTG